MLTMDDIKKDLHVAVPEGASETEIDELIGNAAEKEGDAISEQIEADFLDDLDGLGSFKP